MSPGDMYLTFKEITSLRLWCCKERGSSTSVNPAFIFILHSITIGISNLLGGKTYFGSPNTFTISQSHIYNLSSVFVLSTRIEISSRSKIGVTLFPHPLCKQKSHLAEILSRQAQHLFFTFQILRMKGNMFPWRSQVLEF